MEKIIKTAAEKQKIKEEINKITDRLNRLGTSEFIDGVEIEPGTTYTGFAKGSESLSLTQQRSELEYILINSITPEKLRYEEQKEIEEKESKRKKRSEIAKKAAATRKVKKEKLKIDKANKSKNVNPSLLSIVDKSSIKEELKALIQIKPSKYDWRGIIAVPPSSILSNIMGVFKELTDVPLEIPFFSILSFISAYLVNKKVKIKSSTMGEINPDIWTVILAPSGSAKSTTLNLIKKIVGDDVKFMPKSASSAQFIADLKVYNRGLLIRDEFAQHLRAINEQTYLAEMKEYYLLTYDGDVIERRTKKEQIKVENPCLVILGLNVDETFNKYLSAEDILDGFAQRFSFIIAKKDKERKTINYPDYDIEQIRPVIQSGWNELKQVQIHQEYKVSEKGMEAFRAGFRELYKINIPDSFFRRALFKSIKYALIFHIILKKDNDILDEVDLEWALRVCYMHLTDGKELLEEKDLSELEKVVKHAEELQKEWNSKGKILTPRDLVHYERRINSVSMAKAVLEISGKSEKSSNKVKFFTSPKSLVAPTFPDIQNM